MTIELQRLAWVLVIALVTTLSALPSFATPPAQLDDIKTISVGSTVGNRAEMYSIGLTIFNNKDSFDDLSDLAPSQLLISTAERYLGDHYQVSSFDAPPVFQKKLKISGFNTGPGDLSAEISALPDPKSDAYLVFASSPWVIENARQTLQDFGVYASPNGYKLYLAYVNYDVFLIDATSGRVLRHATGMIPKTGGLGFTDRMLGLKVPARRPETPIVSTNWPRSLDQLDNDQRKELHDDIRRLITESVPFTLSLMGLGGPAGQAVPVSSSAP